MIPQNVALLLTMRFGSKQPVHGRPNLYCCWFPRFLAPPGGSNDGRMLRALGEHLSSLASLGLQEFEEFLRAGLWHQMSRRLSSVERRISPFAARRKPQFWVDDVRRYLRLSREEMVRDEFGIPCDIPLQANAHRASLTFQRLTLAFGELLRQWPDIVQVAKELRARGQRLAEKV
jgi:hypothetical protein